MHIRKSKFGVALLLMTTGCAHYQAQPIVLADIARAQGAHSLQAPCINSMHTSAPQFAKPEYTELELIAAAECFNPELARAKAATQLAAANGELARQYPGLALVLSAEYARKAPESSTWLAAFNLDLPLDFGGPNKSGRVVAPPPV